MTPPSLKHDIRKLILNALETKYVSRSSLNDLPTGNHYQSVQLGRSRTQGFRTFREDVLDRIPFANKTVLDLGSNLGELSRAARNRGAHLVDGFEYDSYFIEIANLINAFNGTSRVSFYQRDITDPGIYNDGYDIVLAFSVFTYIQGVLEEIAKHTRELLILETHRLTDNLESVYLRAVVPYFPYYNVIATTDWGTNKDSSDTRAVVAFSRSEAAVKSIGELATGSSRGTARCADTSPVGELDLARSKFRYLDAFLQKFRSISFDNIDSTLDQAAESVDPLADFTKHEEYGKGLSGWLYWAFFLTGYRNYRLEKEVSANNPYHIYLKRWYQDTRFDPGLDQVFRNPSELLLRISYRFGLLDNIWLRGDANCEPIQLYAPETMNERFALFSIGSGASFSCTHLDGYHRIFCAKLANAKSLPFRTSPSPTETH